jgi:hypothetical protein
MRLVEPLKSGFQTIAPRGGGNNNKTGKKNYGSGKETLRFKANGKATIEGEVSIKTLITKKLIHKDINLIARRLYSVRHRRNKWIVGAILWNQ